MWHGVIRHPGSLPSAALGQPGEDAYFWVSRIPSSEEVVNGKTKTFLRGGKKTLWKPGLTKNESS